MADASHGAEAGQPELQRRKGHAAHQGRDTEMVVAVDEAGQGDHLRAAFAWQIRVARGQVRDGADLGDLSVIDENSRIGEPVEVVVRAKAGKDGAGGQKEGARPLSHWP